MLQRRNPDTFIVAMNPKIKIFGKKAQYNSAERDQYDLMCACCFMIDVGRTFVDQWRDSINDCEDPSASVLEYTKLERYSTETNRDQCRW
jgi:hypothetical protein